MIESKGYDNVPHAAADIMTYGYRKLVRPSQTDMRRSREIFEEIVSRRFADGRQWQGLLAYAVLYKAAILARVKPADLLHWVDYQGGSAHIIKYAHEHFGMRETKTESERGPRRGR